MREIWKDVKEYEGYYQVSNFGRIRSVFRYKKVINIDTGKIYNSFGEIARELNITNASNIVANCKGKKKSAYGYHWQYLDNY